MLSVGVLVDLERGSEAGGQVRCWESLAEAAGGLEDQLELTLHFFGRDNGSLRLFDNVRYITHPPLLGTSRFRSMENIPGHTDLAPFYPRLVSYLRAYDVIHTTDAFFAMAKTAMQFARRSRKALVNSIHTDVPAYAKLYSAQIIARLCRARQVRRLLLGRLHLDDLCLAAMRWRSCRYLRRCDWVLVSREEDLQWLGRTLPDQAVSFLRRGVDKELFRPERRDRRRLEAAFEIPRGRFLLLFVGRVDQGKNVMLLAQAARVLLDWGEPVHLLLVGNGVEKQAIRRILGSAVTFTGIVPHRRLPWIYASADLFIFPSEIEVHPNVVLEARASGLPVLVASGGAAQLVKNPGIDGFVLKEGKPAVWAQLVKQLRLNPDYRAWVGREGRRQVESGCPSWQQVLVNDLLPVWQRVANGVSRQGC